MIARKKSKVKDLSASSAPTTTVAVDVKKLHPTIM